MENLQTFLKNMRPMPTAKADLIASYFEKVTYPKNTLLIEAGKISRKSYFLESGIIRCYIIDLKGDEVTTRFYSAPDFLNDFLSYFEQKPSEENYELITNCLLWSINFENMQHCFHTIPEFREWGRMLLTLNYVHINRHLIALHKQTAQERYLNLLKNYPEIVQTVPLHMIASYLGITKYSLSRIRKEIQ